jgi:hypothetical protein
VNLRRGLENISRAFASLLAETDVDGRQGERRSLHDAAAGVSEENIYLAEKTPIGECVEVNEDV